MSLIVATPRLLVRELNVADVEMLRRMYEEPLLARHPELPASADDESAGIERELEHHHRRPGLGLWGVDDGGTRQCRRNGHYRRRKHYRYRCKQFEPGSEPHVSCSERNLCRTGNDHAYGDRHRCRWHRGTGNLLQRQHTAG